MTTVHVEGGRPGPEARLARGIRTADGERFLAGLAGQRQRLNGCAAAAYAALYANVDVITALPDPALYRDHDEPLPVHRRRDPGRRVHPRGRRACSAVGGVRRRILRSAGVHWLLGGRGDLRLEMYSIISGARIPIQMSIARPHPGPAR